MNTKVCTISVWFMFGYQGFFYFFASLNEIVTHKKIYRMPYTAAAVRNVYRKQHPNHNIPQWCDRSICPTPIDGEKFLFPQNITRTFRKLCIITITYNSFVGVTYDLQRKNMIYTKSTIPTTKHPLINA